MIHAKNLLPAGNLCPSADINLFRFKGYDLSPKGTPKDIGDKDK